MRRVTDTELVRNYCENHKGDIFDINYLSENVFKDIPHVNLRKIVSRLIDAGKLRTISKGVYVIGNSDLSDEEIVIKHYLANDFGSEEGLPVGDYLLFTEGLLDKEPAVKEIKSTRTKGNKRIGNIQVIETHNWFRTALTYNTIATAMELFLAGYPMDMSKVQDYVKKIQLCLSGYTDEKFKTQVSDVYPMNCYSSLASFLNSMGISHHVEEIYEIQRRLHAK